jgi:hypothetical protein
MEGFATKRKGDDHFDAYCIEIRDEQLARQGNLDIMYQHFDKTGLGCTFANEKGDRFALILPDASVPGKFRYQQFASFGWINHWTCDTLDEVVFETYEAGMRLPAPQDTLDKMASTLQWAKGIEQLELITKVNRGELTWEASLALSEKLDEKYAAMAA